MVNIVRTFALLVWNVFRLLELCELSDLGVCVFVICLSSNVFSLSQICNTFSASKLMSNEFLIGLCALDILISGAVTK